MPWAKENQQAATGPPNDEWSTKRVLLSSTLAIAVPLWIERLRNASWEHILLRARECAQHVAEHGDNLLFRSKKKGESAKAFNHLAEGIACLAFAPGGVKLFGSHWEAIAADDWPARSKDALTMFLKAALESLERS